MSDQVQVHPHDDDYDYGYDCSSPGIGIAVSNVKQNQCQNHSATAPVTGKQAKSSAIQRPMDHPLSISAMSAMAAVSVTDEATPNLPGPSTFSSATKEQRHKIEKETLSQSPQHQQQQQQQQQQKRSHPHPCAQQEQQRDIYRQQQEALLQYHQQQQQQQQQKQLLATERQFTCPLQALRQQFLQQQRRLLALQQGVSTNAMLGCSARKQVRFHEIPSVAIIYAGSEMTPEQRKELWYPLCDLEDMKMEVRNISRKLRISTSATTTNESNTPSLLSFESTKRVERFDRYNSISRTTRPVSPPPPFLADDSNAVCPTTNDVAVTSGTEITNEHACTMAKGDCQDETRGLEQRVCLNRQRQKYLAIRCTLKAQMRSRCPEFISRISCKCTQWAKDLAIQEANRDFAEAYNPQSLTTPKILMNKCPIEQIIPLIQSSKRCHEEGGSRDTFKNRCNILLSPTITSAASPPPSSSDLDCHTLHSWNVSSSSLDCQGNALDKQKNVEFGKTLDGCDLNQKMTPDQMERCVRQRCHRNTNAYASSGSHKQWLSSDSNDDDMNNTHDTKHSCEE